MWEATAAAGRLAQLRDWAIDALDGREGEVYLSHQRAGDLVVAIIRSATGTPAPMPDPPPGLTARTPAAWLFEQVHPACATGPDAAADASAARRGDAGSSSR
ncbi:hypothetical protein [Frankia sp. R82]|uniref:hypothetical protein n=1 Tax=Frankia sp. R82 TaxID=2950553 RepID=UPI002042C456|nr:hypothetical protein [Frankia sp. R82]MCM3884987.1 hypothetical protein [Frankia sp. R82]